MAELDVVIHLLMVGPQRTYHEGGGGAQSFRGVGRGEWMGGACTPMPHVHREPG